MVKKFPGEKLNYKKDGKWSIKEILGHLHDLEELWYGRIDDFQDHKKTLRAADLSNAKTNAAGHNSRPLVELLKQFRQTRNKLIARIQDIDETMAGLTALHPRLKTPIRLIDSLYLVAEHHDHELTRIRHLI